MHEDEKPIPLWNKLVALVVALLIIAAIVIFRDRIGADFWPLDRSTVGPNLLASVVQWAIIFVAAVLLYPPWRRRLRRFFDHKVAPLHDKLDQHHQDVLDLHAKIDHLHERHDELHKSIEALHTKASFARREQAQQEAARPKKKLVFTSFDYKILPEDPNKDPE